MESSNNLSSPSKHRYNTRNKNKLDRIDYKENSGTSDSDMSDSDFVEEDNIILDPENYAIFLSQLFPSNHLNGKVKDIKRLKNKIKKKKMYEEEDEDEDSFSEDEEDEDSFSEDDEDEDSFSEDEDEDSFSEDEEEEVNTNKLIIKIDSPKRRKRNPSYNFASLAEKLISSTAENETIKQLVKIANQHKNATRPSKVTKRKDISKKLKEKKREMLKNKRKKQTNAKEFSKLLTEKDNLNDLKYFKKELDLQHQEIMINELKGINAVSTVEKPYRIILLEADIPQVFKISALKKISMLENMDPSVGEYFKLKNWIDTFMRIPFNKYSNLQFTINDGIDKCNEYMQNAVDILDKAVFGLTDAKMQIMQLLGQWIVNPNAIGSAIAIKGPMGTGKTSIVKEGISKILNRPFALIALGGATDASVLEGHGYTYEGSTWGKIVDILIQTKCSNPIIYFDELDKVSDTAKGEEIIGILTHLIDTTQNSNFHDKYFSEIDFDLSKALFIFSYNDESRVNSILRDRMYRISTKGYDTNEKKTIAKDYLIPYINSQIKFEKENINFPDETLEHIIEKYTDGESGVRNFKRCLEIIYTKLNLYRLMKPDSSLFKDDKSFLVEFPFTVTIEIVDKLIKKEKEQENDNWKRMFM